jgi:fido (protein-threonine AMPylation protein)
MPPPTGAVRLISARDQLLRAHMALQLAPADFKSVAVQFEAKASCDIEGVEDDKEIQACVAAIQSSAKRLSLPDLRHVRSLHAEVMSKRPEIAGRLRDCMVWIGGISIETARFIPPPHDAVSSCLTEHFHYLDLATHELSQVQDVVTRLAISHAHFEAVHPFRDGNGRVAFWRVSFCGFGLASGCHCRSDYSASIVLTTMC